MVIPFMTIYCTQKLHFSLGQAGMVMAMFGTGSIAGAFLGGRITDKFGFYPVQIIALLSGGSIFLVVGQLQTFLGLCIGVFILSICNESFRPANSTAIAYYSKPENRVRSYSLNRLAINLGFATGGAVGGFIASVDYHLLFWVDGITNIIAALLMLKLIPRVKYHKDVSETGLRGSSPYKDLTYLFFIFLMILFATCFLQLFGVMPVFYKTQWQISERLIGALMAMNGLIIAMFEMVVVHNMEGKRSPLVYTRIGALLFALGFASINILPASFLSACIAMLLITGGEIFSMPFLNSYWLSRTQAANRGSYAALYTIAWSTAQIIAPTFGAQVAQHAGFHILWWVISGMSLLQILGFGLLQKNQTTPSFKTL